jgi:hypothetical protein
MANNTTALPTLQGNGMQNHAMACAFGTWHFNLLYVHFVSSCITPFLTLLPLQAMIAFLECLALPAATTPASQLHLL